MILTRRRVLEAGGGILAGLLAKPATAAVGPLEIAMQGKHDGSHVWFDPIGLHVKPGQTVRWTNRDRGNSHTVTSYHPEIFARPLRIPAKARPWNSDYLLPDETFSFRFDEEGVYDYYCVPHEHAGMVGRIVVGNPPAIEAAAEAAGLTALPKAALDRVPSVEEIVAKGVVRRE
jgi:plastocyanin